MRILVLILLTLSLSARKPPLRDWLGQHDDVAHFYAGFFATWTAAEITYYYTDRPGLSSLVGMGTGVALGFGKEYIWDKGMKRGVFSYDDLFITCWGAIIGAMVIRCVFDWRDRKREAFKIDPFDSQLTNKQTGRKFRVGIPIKFN